MDYKLRFDPKTIEHLGVKMYSTLPPAIAELISNAYDADASEVEVLFQEVNGSPVSITVKDNGHGMTAEDIQEHFLVIGRNRRAHNDDAPTLKYGRLPTGKKGLGKLALFGLAKRIVLDTIKDKKRNRFELDWEKLIASDQVYRPESDIEDEEVETGDGTTIVLEELKRKSSFDIESLANSLSKIFIVDEDFKIVLTDSSGDSIEVTNALRYAQIEKEFEWTKKSFDLEAFEFTESIEFSLMTAKTPIKPSSGLRGITIFSRGKLVNAPEFFSSSTSSHFYQYLTGWIQADFIDLLDEDVISTNRQSINWENEVMVNFRKWLIDIISKTGASWRNKRKEKKEEQFKKRTGIDKENWFSSLPDDVRQSAQKIVGSLSDDEGVDETFSPVVEALHAIIPEYPSLHWRHLHPEIQEASAHGYKSENYYAAFLEAAKRYANRTREYAGITGKEPDMDVMGKVFGPEPEKILKIAAGYFRMNGTEFAANTIQNMEGAQRKFSQGVIEGGRNVVAHEEILDLSSSRLFSESDCLDLLSLVSHLMYRIERCNERKREASS